MFKSLEVCAGACTSAGNKNQNQDSYGFLIPDSTACASKGIVAAVADGISTSNVSHVASQTAINSFVNDYYCTPEAWSVKTSAQRVLQATNSWLFAQSQNSPNRFNKDKGYICTFSGLIFKSNTVHVFHSGDSRIYHFRDQHLEQLTVDHRRQVSEQESYLTRALGIHQQLDLDYTTQPLEVGDLFLLATDGVFEFCDDLFLKTILSEGQASDCDLNNLCHKVVDHALARGSDDNLTLQIIRVDDLPEQKIAEVQQQISELPLPPPLHPRIEFDGYLIQRELYISSRSHVFLAQDLENEKQVVIKVPSTELKDNPDYLESLLLEDWIAQRLDNPHVLKAYKPARKKNYLYLATEFINGQSLAQWMIDHPKPNLTQVRDIISQIAKGLQAFHRQEMLHQDLRPNNIMIDANGIVKIIDFGATQVAGVSDIKSLASVHQVPGTAQFSAPEYFFKLSPNLEIDSRADIFSLGIICYQMLTSSLPYGLGISKVRSQKDLNKLSYQPLMQNKNSCEGVPVWCDLAIKKAVHLEPRKRYYEVSEFIYDLHHPNREFERLSKPPLIERDPVKFWQGLSLTLFILLLLQLDS